VLSGLTQGAFDRAAGHEDEELDVLRDDLDRFVRFYSFLSQVVPFLTAGSEKLYARSRGSSRSGSASVVSAEGSRSTCR